MNTNLTPSTPLPHIGLLRFAGTDAASFLQGQVSNDTARLSAGSPLLAAYSTPQGRVAAIMHLLPHSSGILALLPREIVLPTLERLRKFVMRAKVTIEDVGDQFAVLGQLQAPDLSSDPGYHEKDGVGVGRVGTGGRSWIVGTLRDLERSGLATGAASRAQSENAWRLADIRAGLPQVYSATREMFVAQMLNMDLVDGISFKKGCYTGQEIIARTQHLGRIKRRLFRLGLPEGSWAIGQAVHLTDGRSGRITDLAREGAKCEALAVLGADSDATSAPIDAVSLPLPYSVAAP